MTRYRFSARAGRALGACFIVIALAGCGIRVGDPPAPIPTPDSSEAQRQKLAVALERVINAADLGRDPAAPAGLVTTLSAYLDELGGVWIPPPRDEDPSPSSPASTGEVPELDAALEESSAALAEGVASGGAHNPEALASMWLTLRTASAALTREAPPPCSAPCGGQVIPPAFVAALSSGEENREVAALAELVPTEAPELIGIYDALGYIEQIRAARAPTEERQELAQGAHELRRFADLLAGDAAGTESDTRLSAYHLDVDDLGAGALGYLQAATAQWLTLVPKAAPESTDLAFDTLWHTYASANPDLQIEPWPGLDP